MDNLDTLKRVVAILKSQREIQNFSISQISKATNIPVRVISKIEECDAELYSDNKMLFIRYCKVYKEFLKIEGNEDFHRIRENFISSKDKEYIDLDQLKKPSSGNFEIAFVIALICWVVVFTTHHLREKAVRSDLRSDKIIYFEYLGGL